MTTFERRKALIETRYEELVTRANIPLEGNGIYTRYAHPVITADMVPPFWKYDYDPERNPYFMERIGVNATLNAHSTQTFPAGSDRIYSGNVGQWVKFANTIKLRLALRVV